jgi:hypothetical protein
MPQEDSFTSELNHPEEILCVVFPANDGATKIIHQGKRSVYFPTATIGTQAATALSCGEHAQRFMRRDEWHAVASLGALVQWIADVSAVTDRIGSTSFSQGKAGKHAADNPSKEKSARTEVTRKSNRQRQDGIQTWFD